MRKEIIFAIVAGSLAGILIAFGVWRANIALKPKKQEQVSSAEETSDEPVIGLTLAKPKDSSVLTEDSVVVTGITSPQAWIVVSNQDRDLITQSEIDGTFELEVDLVGGLNELLVTAFDPNGVATQSSFGVVYSTEFKKHLSEVQDPEDNEATNEADLIREKVKEKIEVAKKSPVYYLGSVTDISEKTLQVKAQSGEIKQISVGDETDFVNVVKSNQDIDFEDVAIGDFVISMGFVNGNEVMEGKRVLVTTQSKGSGFSVNYGIIASIDGKEVVLNAINGEAITLKFPKSWEGPNINKLSEGDILIAIGTFEDELLEIRTIELVTVEPTPSASPPPSATVEPSPSAQVEVE